MNRTKWEILLWNIVFCQSTRQNVQANFSNSRRMIRLKQTVRRKRKVMSSLNDKTVSLIYIRTEGLNRATAISELEIFMESYLTDLVALVETQPNGASPNGNQPLLKGFTDACVFRSKNHKTEGNLATFIKNGSVVKHLQAHNLAHQEFVERIDKSWGTLECRRGLFRKWCEEVVSGIYNFGVN